MLRTAPGIKLPSCRINGFKASWWRCADPSPRKIRRRYIEKTRRGQIEEYRGDRLKNTERTDEKYGEDRLAPKRRPPTDGWSRSSLVTEPPPSSQNSSQLKAKNVN